MEAKPQAAPQQRAGFKQLEGRKMMSRRQEEQHGQAGMRLPWSRAAVCGEGLKPQAHEAQLIEA